MHLELKTEVDPPNQDTTATANRMRRVEVFWKRNKFFHELFSRRVGVIANTRNTMVDEYQIELHELSVGGGRIFLNTLFEMK